jgi:hypothetical protein
MCTKKNGSRASVHPSFLEFHTVGYTPVFYVPRFILLDSLESRELVSEIRILIAIL